MSLESILDDCDNDIVEIANYECSTELKIEAIHYLIDNNNWDDDDVIFNCNMISEIEEQLPILDYFLSKIEIKSYIYFNSYHDDVILSLESLKYLQNRTPIKFDQIIRKELIKFLVYINHNGEGEDEY